MARLAFVALVALALVACTFALKPAVLPAPVGSHGTVHGYPSSLGDIRPVASAAAGASRPRRGSSSAAAAASSSSGFRH